jgi:hypothetical protein
MSHGARMALPWQVGDTQQHCVLLMHMPAGLDTAVLQSSA